jgi:hypothetical protein
MRGGDTEARTLVQFVNIEQQEPGQDQVVQKIDSLMIKKPPNLRAESNQVEIDAKDHRPRRLGHPVLT